LQTVYVANPDDQVASPVGAVFVATLTLSSLWLVEHVAAEVGVIEATVAFWFHLSNDSVSVMHASIPPSAGAITPPALVEALLLSIRFAKPASGNLARSWPSPWNCAWRSFC